MIQFFYAIYFLTEEKHKFIKKNVLILLCLTHIIKDD